MRYQARMKAYLLVFFGAGFGGMLRHGVNVGCGRLCGTEFPWGILIINVTGCLAMGLIAGWLAFRTQQGWSQDVRLLLTTGVLGGYTTFSAFSLDSVLLAERGEWLLAATYVLLSVGLAIAGLMGGLALVRQLS